MKINRLETHDRLLHFIKDQSISISQGADDCLKKNRLSLALQELSPYVYLFAHPRTADDGVTKIMYWQPRLTKPKPETNSYLFRAKSKTDILEVCWLLPPPETWDQFKKGNITENEWVIWSINQFTTNREWLGSKESDDFIDDAARDIYKKLVNELKQETSAASLIYS